MVPVASHGLIRPVVLCGGSGTRLWPLSREKSPKQLLRIAGTSSMIYDTISRFGDSARFAPPIVMTNEELRFSVAEQLRLTGIDGTIVLEPQARNTAPAAAAAALLAMEDNTDAVILVVPSDHVIRNVQGFLALVADALPAAMDGYLVTLALRPTRPETGFGYIRLGAAIPHYQGMHAVVSFVEKPNSERANEFVRSGEYFWNGGMFLLSARSYWAELERFAPAVCEAVRPAVAARRGDRDFVRLERTSFAASPNISIDYAVMEKTDRAATIVCDIGWTDLGSWSELWEIGKKDADGNVIMGDAFAEGTHNSYVRSEGPLTAVVGAEGMVVVVTDDAVLVTSVDHAQDVKRIVERLRAAGRPELTSPKRVDRPWGYYQSLHMGDRFLVMRLSLNPGAKLSLRRHHHRAEHWIVVNGTASVTCGEDRKVLGENESIRIPLGVEHRLENSGEVPLDLIEVQSGMSLGDDEAVGLADERA